MDNLRYLELQFRSAKTLINFQKEHLNLLAAYVSEKMGTDRVLTPPEKNTLERKKWIVDALNELGDVLLIKRFGITAFQNSGAEILLSSQYSGGPIPIRAWSAMFAIETLHLDEISIPEINTARGRPKSQNNIMAAFGIHKMKEQMVSEGISKPKTRDAIRRLIIMFEKEPSKQTPLFQLRENEEYKEDIEDAVIRIEKYMQKNKDAIAEHKNVMAVGMLSLSLLASQKTTPKIWKDLFLLE